EQVVDAQRVVHDELVEGRVERGHGHVRDLHQHALERGGAAAAGRDLGGQGDHRRGRGVTARLHDHGGGGQLDLVVEDRDGRARHVDAVADHGRVVAEDEDAGEVGAGEADVAVAHLQ